MYSPFVCNKRLLQESYIHMNVILPLQLKIYYVYYFEMTVNIPVMFGE